MVGICGFEILLVFYVFSSSFSVLKGGKRNYTVCFLGVGLNVTREEKREIWDYKQVLPS